MRVREARLAAGLSLGQLAGDDVSRTFIHLVEHGRSRPSKPVLELIARRTGKPISYFLARAAKKASAADDLIGRLSDVEARVNRFIAVNRLTKLERDAMKLVQVTLHQGAAIVKTIQKKPLQ
jgi:transcriptional regulator with XRE-family HTH domain